MIEIDALHIKIPGLSEREGRQLAAAVSQGLALQMPDGMSSRHLDRLDLQLTTSGANSQAQLAQQIVHAIIQQLQAT